VTIPDSETIASIEESFRKLDAWIGQEDFAGWEPHDALNSALLKRVAGGNHLVGIILVQTLRRFPINVRPWLGIEKGYNPKAMGLFLQSYSQWFLADRDPKQLELIRFFLDWLGEHSSPGYSGPCWGYNFDWPNRDFFAVAGTPTIVNTAYIGLGLLAAEEALRGTSELRFGRRKDELCPDPLALAIGACEFIMRDLKVLQPSSDEACFSYTPFDERFVHNANLMGAWLLAAVYNRTGDKRLRQLAEAAARFSVRRQRSDGSWPYGLSRRDQWIDNFHTGFVLVALREIGLLLGTSEWEAAVQRGYECWKSTMFVDGYLPKYYPDKVYPLDVHCVAQAVLTFMSFASDHSDAAERATKLCKWAITNLQDAKGFFHYQIHPLYRIRIPYMRWGQAWMHLALTRYLHSVCVPTRPQEVVA
jgi:hypothetical protein